MSFKDSKTYVHQEFLKLENDEDRALVIFLEEPTPCGVDYNGKTSVRFAFPILHEGIVKLFTQSQRFMLMMDDKWGDFYNRECLIQRFGKKAPAAGYAQPRRGVASVPRGFPVLFLI